MVACVCSAIAVDSDRILKLKMKSMRNAKGHKVFAQLTNNRIIAQQETNVVQHDAPVIAVIKLHVDVFIVDVRVRRAGSGSDARV